MEYLRTHPVIAVLIGAVMISFSAVWVNISDVAPTVSAFYRVFFGFLFLGAARAASGDSLSSLRAILLPTAACGLTFALDLYFWHASIRYIGPGLATIIGNFQVFLMAACGVLFFHEKLKLRFLLSVPLAVAGLLLLIGFKWSGLPVNYRTGILLGFMTAIAYTGYLLLLRNIQTNRSNSDTYGPLMLISFFSALFLAASIVFQNDSFAIPTLKSGVALVSLGFFSQALGWFIIAGSIAKIPASFTGLILLLQPSLSFIWDVLFFARPTSSIQWIGAILTLWAIYLGLTGSRVMKK